MVERDFRRHGRTDQGLSVTLRFILSLNSLFKVYQRDGCHEVIHERYKMKRRDRPCITSLSVGLFLHPGGHTLDMFQTKVVKVK